jgi:hypothetical protein
MKIRLGLILVLLSVAFVGCDLGTQQDQKFTPSELKEDIDFLFQTLEAVHPNLYAYTPKEMITQEKERIENEITSPMSRIDFYIKIAPLVAKLKDGHTWVYWPDEEYNHYVENDGLLFPFNLHFSDGRAFIVANYSSDSLIAVNSELYSINGISIGSIADSLLQFISGERLYSRRWWLGGDFRRELWLIYKFDQEFEVEFVSGLTGERLTRKVSGVTRETMRATIKTKSGRGSKDEKTVYYTYHSFPQERIGIIDFRLFKDLSQFKTFLKETFTQIKKDSIENLIIDIRKNPGGTSNLGDTLLSYITGKPFTQFSREEVKVSKQILPWYLRWLPLKDLFPSGRKIRTFEPKTPGENSLRFNGNVYVLIDAGTFSSATAFATAIKDYKLGTLIGEETGGLATSFGAVYNFNLPETQIKVGVSRKRLVRPSGEDDGRGILPDYEVKQSIEDLKKGIDTVMEFTKELISSKREKSSS